MPVNSQKQSRFAFPHNHAVKSCFLARIRVNSCMGASDNDLSFGRNRPNVGQGLFCRHELRSSRADCVVRKTTRDIFDRAVENKSVYAMEYQSFLEVE